MTFADKLQRLMKQKGLSQQSLSELLTAEGVAVSQRAVSGWTSGSMPRPSVLAKLAEVFAVNVHVLEDDSFELPETGAPRFGGYEVTDKMFQVMEGNVEAASRERAAIIKVMGRIEKMQKELTALRADLEELL